MSKIGTGISIQRKEANSKTAGAAKYRDDETMPDALHARILTSPHAHALILSVDISAASRIRGVRAVVTGGTALPLCGTLISDQPPFAYGKVRYFGEPVAAVIADDEHAAAIAVKLIKIEYQPLACVASARAAAAPGSVLVHEDLGKYALQEKDVYPEPGTNICHRTLIRKGDTGGEIWQRCAYTASGSYILPKSTHAAMETRSASAELTPDGEVIIDASTQGPFSVQKEVSRLFNIKEGNVIVKTPFVGGGFGGKAAVSLEILAYVCSAAVGGRRVSITNTREDDTASSPSRIGLEADIKLGADAEGNLIAADMTFYVDAGAYCDITPRIAKAIAGACSGPYRIDDLKCDALAVYTNHTYSTSFRGFGHAEYAFCVERTIDKLAAAIGADPAELRLRNVLKKGDTTPTQVTVNPGILGDPAGCIEKAKYLIGWDGGAPVKAAGGLVRAKGFACFWKTSTSPTDAVSGAVITFDTQGGVNLNCGAVEIGPGTKTGVAQILAEKFKMDVNDIHVTMSADTRYNPKHWKTVASMSMYMLGNAVMRAADDASSKLRRIAASALRCDPEDLEIADKRVFLRSDPTVFALFKDIVHGYKYPDGTAVGGQVIGSGSFIMNRLTLLDPKTGRGIPGPGWTVGAQAAEVELDPRDFSFRVLRIATALDAGRVINPKTARGIVTGAACMGLGLATREAFEYGTAGELRNTSLRTYKLTHFGEQPEYLVEFLETPQPDAPFGARGIAEHGIIGVPAAVCNALSAAIGAEVDSLPATPEALWRLTR